MEIEEIKKILDDHEERIKKLEGNKITNNTTNPSSDGKKLSINEFILEKKPKDDLQVTITLAYYLEKIAGYTNFNVNDIEDSFTKSKSKKPANIHDKINKCIIKGWISEHHEKKNEKKSYYITNTGISTVENNFQSEKVE